MPIITLYCMLLVGFISIFINVTVEIAEPAGFNLAELEEGQDILNSKRLLVHLHYRKK